MINHSKNVIFLLFKSVIKVAFDSKISLSNAASGWCRNKKYIEQVPSGYMCTVCHKVYGRYNSVSYHVTIYHRNSPIKCDEKGCPFRTREARYIHFHKYYRHHIPLPDNIDLGIFPVSSYKNQAVLSWLSRVFQLDISSGSRKCPFCRHVSKSPAMLEKHISRHVQDADRVASAVAGKPRANISSPYTQNFCNFRCSKYGFKYFLVKATIFLIKNRSY